MKRLITLLFALVILYTYSWGQVSGYSFASSSGSYTAITGGTVLIQGTSAMDSWVSSAITIPSFTFGNVAYTTAYVTSNGQISLGGSAPSTTTYTGISTGVGSGINICPFSADLNRATTTTSSEIRWETVGNEIVFQWQQIQRYNATENWDMQARLNTSTGVVSFIYKLNSGPGTSTSYQPQVGIRTSSTDYKNRLVSTGTEDWPTSLPGAVNTDLCRFTSTSPAKSFTTGLTYTFTPPPPCSAPVNQPTALNLTPGYSSISGSFTVAAGSDSYLVVRSTSSSLSANPVNGTTYAVGNSLGGGTVDYFGTSNTFLSSGLTSGTLYYYFIFSANSLCTGGPLYLTASPLTGSATTSAIPSTYTWNQTGTASYITAANWTPARNVVDPTDILVFNNGNTSTVTNVPTQTISRLNISNNTVINMQSATTATLTIASDGTSTDELFVENGSTLLSDGNAAALTITYSGTSSTGTIAGTMELSATSTYAHSFNFTGGTTPVTTVSGTLANGQNGGTGVPTITGSTTALVFSPTGTYIHKFTTSNGTIPTATWNAASNCNIVGYTGTNMVPSGLAQTFGNFTWNCTGQGTNNYNLSLTSTTFNVAGTFSVLSTGTTGSLRLGGTGSYSANVGNLVVSGGILDLQSGSSGTPSLNISGSVTQSSPGIIQSSATSTGNPTLHFNGTINQSVSFATQPTGPITFRISNPAGITLNGSFPTFTFGNGTLGGLRISTNYNTPISLSGSLTTLAYNAANSTLTFDATGVTTASALIFPTSGGPTSLTVNMGNLNMLAIPFDRTISNTLTLTSGDVNMGSYTLTLGTGTTVTGTLSGTSGSIIGNFKRWYAAATGSKDFLVGILGTQRKATINFTAAPSSGGTLTVSFVPNDPGDAGLPLTEGSINVNTAANSGYWKIDAGDGLTGGTYTGTFTATNFPGVNSYAGLVLIKRPSGGGDWTLNGTHVTTTGSNSIPVLSRTGMTGFSEFGVGGDAASNPMSGTTILSVASGNWGDGSTWSTSTVPTSGDNVTILPGHTVLTAGGTPPYACLNLNIAATGVLNVSGADIAIAGTLTNNGTFNCTGSGATIAVGITNAATTGTFNISGGIVTLGPAGGGKTTFTNNGTLTVSGTATLNINGNLYHASGATFNQSGGNINIDGNAAGVTANSVASGTYLLSLNAAVNWTGGTLTIIDPHAATTATYSLYYNSGTSLDVPAGHTLRFGDGVSSDAGGNTAGFYTYNWAGSGKINFGNLIINGPGTGTASGSNRMWTIATYSQGIIGNLTINANGEINTGIGITLAGNLVINSGGTLTHTGTFVLGLPAGSSTNVNPNPQQITNNGTIRNLAASPTANFSSLTINNNNATGVTLNSPISISGTLTLTSGFVNTTATNILTLGTATAAGTLSGGSATAYIIGSFARTFAASRTASGTFGATTLYPVGKGTTYQPMWIDPSTGSGGAVVMSGEAFLTNSGTMGPGVTSLSQPRWEGRVISGLANLTNSYIQISDAGISASNAILQAPSSAGVYGGIPASSVYNAGPPIILKTGSAILAASYTGYFAYGNLTPCPTPTAQPTAFVASFKTSTGFVGSFTAASPAADYYLAVRYTGTYTPTAPVNNTLYTVGGTLGTGTVVSVSNSTTFTETALTANTTYDYYIYSYNNSGCSGPVYLTTSPLTGSVTTCATAVGAPGTPTCPWVGPYSFKAAWTASSTPPVSYILDVATNSTFTSFVSGYNGKNVGTNLNDSIIGLSPATTYYVRVMAYDNGSCYSLYSGTLTQTTLCVPETAPTAVQDFSTYTGSAPPPSCWLEATGVLAASSTLTYGSSEWLSEAGFANTGSNKAVRVNLYSTGNDWLISQQIDLGPTPGLFRIKYNMAVTNYLGTLLQTTLGTHKVDIVVSTDGGTTWSNTNVVKTYTGAGTYSNTGQIELINLTAYSGIVRIAFVETTSSSSPDIDFHIDDFQVEAIPTVPIINVNPGTLAFGYTPSGGTSNVKYYILSGQFLNPPAGNLTVTPPANFEVSLSISSGFSASAINVPYTGGAVTDTVYARFKPTSPNTPYSGNIANAGGSAPSQDVAVTGSSALVYCASAATNLTDEWITNVTFAGINNNSGSTGYSDFRSISGTVSPGSSNSFSASIFIDGSYAETVTVWIDWNQNAVFESGERVQIGSCNLDGCIVTADIVAPLDAVPGSTGMRVVLKYSSYQTDPCATFTYGEVEDYSVTVNAPPACPPPTNATTDNITENSARANWSYGTPPDSFFDVYLTPEGGTPSGPGTMYTGKTSPFVINNPPLSPNTTYNWYVKAHCSEFTDNKDVDNFWFAMDQVDTVPGLNGGFPVNDPHEDGKWYRYYDTIQMRSWYNIWFYNDPLDTTRMKKIRMGFWVSSYDMMNPGQINFVVNWSDSSWHGMGFPLPTNENFVRRSPLNVLPVTPIATWCELYWEIPDFNPAWVSVDIWGENILIEKYPMAPPDTSLLFQYWLPGMKGGMIIHECLPKPDGNTSTWVGPQTFTTNKLPAAIPFTETFEVTPSDWTLVNGTQPNKWVVGSATTHNGLKSAYVSDDNGTTNNYNTSSASIVHAYRDISFTGGPGGYTLKFWWKGQGEYEVATLTAWDRMNAYLVDVSTAPAAGTELSSGAIGIIYQLQGSWVEATIELPGSLTGSTKRLVFSWTNDALVGTQPPAAIDDISIEIGAYTWKGTTSSDWNDPTNWDRGLVPTASCKVIIPSDPVSEPNVFPVVTGTYSCYSLTVGTGASVTVESPGVLNVLNP